ncbi:hypothetical protein BD410DRAFT_898552 [Rickenella mellea]|uniref:F-box domain-containing protein n=1 Tax=Rickenella mellea TaxID=50990 RepID=A0A4Y7Q3Q2_9AGAM|nr:hypothetical protein BD410DRAFT_898552 [Rickenella mellea]
MDGARSPPWKVFWEHGMEASRLSKYVESLAQFDKAASRRSDEQVIFESRSVALEMLGRYEEALRDSKRVIDLAPASYEGYARSSQILFKTGKLHASLEMANHALKRVNECDQGQRDELLCLKRQILSSLTKGVTSASHFDKLPFDIASIIFTLAVREDTSRSITMSHVCQSWRAMALKMPTLWNSVVIGRRLEVQMAEVFLKRTNGNIKRLEIHYDFGFFQKNFFGRHAHDSFWSQLETLALINVPESDPPHHFIPWEKLRLTHFILTSKHHFMHTSYSLWEALNLMSFHSIKSVAFTGPFVPPSHFERYSNLTKLEFHFKAPRMLYPQQGLTSLFYNNPGLNTVILDVLVAELTEIRRPTPFAMTSLVRLESFRYGSWLANLLRGGAFSFPAIQILHLYKPVNLREYLFLLKPFAANLVDLRISNIERSAPTPMLISFLQASHNLVTLDLSGFYTNLSDEMDALAGRNQSMICLKLEHVHFGSCNTLSSASLINLVHSRLSHAKEDNIGALHGALAITNTTMEPRHSENLEKSTYDGIGGDTTVMAIQSLTIEHCALIDSDTIRRLMTMVKQIRYVPSLSFTRKTPQAPKRGAWR